MIDDDDLADECFCDSRWVVRVTHDLASPNLILSNTTDVEPNVVSGFSLRHSNVVGLDRLALADFAGGHEDYLVSVLQYSSLDPSYRDSPDSGYGVDVLDWNSQWLVERLGRWNNSVESIKYAWTLVPWSIGALLCKVVSQPSAGGNEINLGNIIANRLQQSFQFLPGLLVTLLSVLDRLIIHLVDIYNSLLNAQSPCEV